MKNAGCFFRYTRNLIDAGNGKFNLMCLCWGEGHGSSIHDHADSHCFVKILRGDLQETMYDWPETQDEETEMHKKDVNVYPKDGVTYINGEQASSYFRILYRGLTRFGTLIF